MCGTSNHMQITNYIYVYLILEGPFIVNAGGGREKVKTYAPKGQKHVTPCYHEVNLHNPLLDETKTT